MTTGTSADTGDPGALPHGRATDAFRSVGIASATQWTLRALWDLVIPALGAAVAVRFFVPTVASGFPGVIARLGREQPVSLGAALFVLFAGLVHYWRFWLPGGRFASSLAAHLVPAEKDGGRLAAWASFAARYRLFASPRFRGALSRVLGSEKVDEITATLGELGAALHAADMTRAHAASARLRNLARPVLVARQRRAVASAMAAVAAAAACALALRAKVVESYVVLSGSMLPTLEPQDRIGGNKMAYRTTRPLGVPARGDVIVFRANTVALGPRAGVPDHLVKRVIGLPGDRVAMVGGTPIINGWRVPTCEAGDYLYVEPDGHGRSFHARLRVEFLDDRAYLTVQSMTAPFPETYVVGENEVFVLGDNRSNSIDSRAYNEGRGGGVPFSGIEARAQWFLIGLHRTGDADFGRLFWPIDAMATHFRVEGVDGSSPEAAIARCLANRPSETRPPAARPGAAATNGRSP